MNGRARLFVQMDYDCWSTALPLPSSPHGNHTERLWQLRT